MTHRIAVPLIALVVAGACSNPDVTAPARQDPAAASAAQAAGPALSSARSGALHITKNCAAFTHLAGSYCTITSSNLASIPVGTRVVYASDAAATSLNSDVVLVPPGPGKSVAFGHVFLDFRTKTGVVTLSGGTGKFEHVKANVVVTFLGGGPNWAWDGTYSFNDDDGDNAIGEGDDHEPPAPRGGALHVQKECSTYRGQVNDICTVTKSNIRIIEIGSAIRYLGAVDFVHMTYDDDVVLDMPGRGHNVAFGHCVVDFAKGAGVCSFSGGTGKFKFFHARVDVRPLGGVDYAWDGTYSFSRPD